MIKLNKDRRLQYKNNNKCRYSRLFRFLKNSYVRQLIVIKIFLMKFLVENGNWKSKIECIFCWINISAILERKQKFVIRLPPKPSICNVFECPILLRVDSDISLQNHH